VHTYQDKYENVISLIDSESIPCIATEKTKNFLSITEKGVIKEVLNPLSTIKKIVFGYKDPNLGPDGEILTPNDYQVKAYRTQTIPRGILKMDTPIRGGSGTPSSHRSSHHSNSTSRHSGAVSLNSKSRISSLSKSRDDDNSDDFRYTRTGKTTPEDLFETPTGSLPEGETSDLVSKSDFKDLMNNPSYQRATSERSESQSQRAGPSNTAPKKETSGTELETLEINPVSYTPAEVPRDDLVRSVSFTGDNLLEPLTKISSEPPDSTE